ncbi:D-glycero-beta-D-manno-heptose 1-phosphate adenylyltransferase [Pedobacter sp. HMF7647]|uniref:D-glycero-beta-D-manno-heptose 1-phosphate adenylyltransferase n=1 Tax=Hufsiella arboris TaxID=2695275 RepID=A0A7K1Y600_9SPHI|nr:D-glycero-beta-D-manno-heptose 1-phosphate adenylyltransferase [Hufsiella arboris]MXV50002.1 D-glycero-beta-D-manno-heptose 1-phosphate adenylyltransferase [Hufsiella arboris]
MISKLSIIENKILTPAKLAPLLNMWRFQGREIVFTNGCFDLLHLGHVDYLSKAADLGDELVIGLNSDASTSSLKGPNRPITDERSRAHILASLFFVSAVVLFDESTPFDLINFVKPDVLVKGADYTIDKIVGADLVISNGGKVETIEFIEGYSTTAIEKKIKNS